MFDELFMQIIDMSKVAGIVILIVLIARFLLKKAPKVISYALWAVVLFRLLCPVSIEAPVSVVPEMTPISSGYTLADEPISIAGAGIAACQAVGDALNGGLGIQHIPTTETDENGIAIYATSDWWDVWILFGQYVWLGGILVMAVYGVVTYLRLRRRLITASPLRDNIYLADEIDSPFVMGLIRPKIYLPSEMEEREQSYIILHEQYHIRRLDHIVKALAFVALCIHWFNPLVWVAFILSGKDMEMSCDEAVVRKLGTQIRADYTASLLSLATGKRIIAGMPLAFGEGNTKGRIKNLANWKKPAFWVMLVAVVACIVLAVCLLTNPPARREFPINGKNVSELDTDLVIEKIAAAENLEDSSLLCVNADNFDLMFTPDFDWANDGAIRFFYTKNQKTYSAQIRMFHDDNKYFITERSDWVEQNQSFKLFHYLDALKYMPQEEIRKLSPDADGYSVMQIHEGAPSDYERVLKYCQNGVEEIDGWHIHLTVQPLYEVNGAYNGSGDEVIHLFYNGGDPAKTPANETISGYPYPLMMVPTDTDLVGLHAGALLLPVGDVTYRYDLTDYGPAGVTKDELLIVFTEPAGNEKIDWEVYSLEEYPDRSVVLIESENDGSWICTYSPPGRCSDSALEDAMATPHKNKELKYTR